MKNRLNTNPFYNQDELGNSAPWSMFGIWPCKWIRCDSKGDGKVDGKVDEPFVSAFRNRFSIDEPFQIKVYVTADERYELFLDGKLIGRGSERGDKYNWYYETYTLDLNPGDHVIVARVWAFKHLRPAAQMTVAPGFLFCPQEESAIKMLGTGVSNWDGMILNGYEFVPFQDDAPQWVCTGTKLRIDGNAFPWGFELGEGEGWTPAISFESGYWGNCNYIQDDVHVLRPGSLLPQMHERRAVGSIRWVQNIESMSNLENTLLQDNLINEHHKWQSILTGDSIIVEPHTCKRILIDLGNYYCMYPHLSISGGKDSLIRIYWGEALYIKDENMQLTKDQRNMFEQRYFRGVGDTFIADGGDHRQFDTLWWHSGRYIEIVVKTEKEPLTINHLSLYETRYPLEMENTFECDDPQWARIKDICFRTLQMCAHETYMDCPYYEQLMYVGDTRLQLLVNYTSSSESLLPEKAIQAFEQSSFNLSGLIKCAYPDSTGKIIPSFCLWWIGMVYDYALWKGKKSFIRPLMPTVRKIVDLYMSSKNEQGLLPNPEGWNFYDWANDSDNKIYVDDFHWSYGVPGRNGDNVNGLFNWHMVLTLRYLSELEAYLGEHELSVRAKRLGQELSSSAVKYFWNDEKGIFADDLNHTMYSEHTQSLAVLSGFLNDYQKDKLKSALMNEERLIKTSIYFSHYFIEALRDLKCEELISRKLSTWNTLLTDELKTTPEIFSNETRSDCHAWGAHPVYHMFATVLGVRPGSMGFETVDVNPMFLHLKHIKGKIKHPKGIIEVDLTKVGDEVKGHVELPEGVKVVDKELGEPNFFLNK